jgi:hypothetical protein
MLKNANLESIIKHIGSAEKCLFFLVGCYNYTRILNNNKTIIFKFQYFPLFSFKKKNMKIHDKSRSLENV